jgi:protein-tyrosine phosphatase
VSTLYLIDEFGPGKLALAARPRGGDWLPDDVANWKRSGIGLVVSLLTPDEARDLQLSGESRETQSQGLEFFSFPIPDRDVPASESEVGRLLERIDQKLSSGKNVLVHCRQGIGRSGIIAACLLVKRGISPGAAVQTVSQARGIPVPETTEQREWIDHFAAVSQK